MVRDLSSAAGAHCDAGAGMSGGLFDRLANRLDDGAEPEASFAMADLLDLPEDERVVMRHVMRQTVPTSIDGLAGELGRDVAEVSAVVARLVERRALVIDGGRIEVAPIALIRRSSPGGLWDRLSDL
ncbi:MAG: hypothetical protein RL119_946 [Actinomycetota bacterium]